MIIWADGINNEIKFISRTSILICINDQFVRMWVVIWYVLFLRDICITWNTISYDLKYDNAS